MSEEVGRCRGHRTLEATVSAITFQVSFGFARMLLTGMVDGGKHLPLIPKVATSNPAIEGIFYISVLSLFQTLTLTFKLWSLCLILSIKHFNILCLRNMDELL
jgi:hypothetical protein